MPTSRRWGRRSSLMKTDTFNDENQDSDASGSGGSFRRLPGSPLVSGQSRPAATSFFVNTWFGVCGIVWSYFGFAQPSPQLGKSFALEKIWSSKSSPK